MTQNLETDSLNSQKPQYGSVYFLGSGASASAGAPTFANFQDQALQISNKLRDNEIFQEVWIDWITKFKDYNIEEYFSGIELGEMITLNENVPPSSRKITTDDVTYFIAKTIEEALNDVKSDAYNKFICEIIEPKDAIITTNWDILLERNV